MPAKPGKEQPLLKRFISVYENNAWADAHCDWVDERKDRAVELLATRRRDAITLAIEHTLIQPYPREKEDFARFERAFLRNGRDRSLEVSEAVLYVDVPGGTLQSGDDWDAVADAVRDCIRRNKQALPEGRSGLFCSIVSGKTITLQIRRQSIPGDDGQTIIRRYGPFDLSSTIRTALENKLPKLVATRADKRILMLERDQWHVNQAAIAGELIECLRGDFPLLTSVDELCVRAHHLGRLPPRSIIGTPCTSTGSAI
jgi:hypothetical protein